MKGDKLMALKEWKTISPKYRKSLNLTKKLFMDEFEIELEYLRNKKNRK